MRRGASVVIGRRGRGPVCQMSPAAWPISTQYYVTKNWLQISPRYRAMVILCPSHQQRVVIIYLSQLINHGHTYLESVPESLGQLVSTWHCDFFPFWEKFFHNCIAHVTRLLPGWEEYFLPQFNAHDCVRPFFRLRKKFLNFWIFPFWALWIRAFCSLGISA